MKKRIPYEKLSWQDMRQPQDERDPVTMRSQFRGIFS